MINEMDIMKMDAPSRNAWLSANRVTLMIVGLVWIGMIAIRLAEGKDAWFLISMIPVFALTRLAAYLYIKRSRRKAAAHIDTGVLPGRTDRQHATPGYLDASGRPARSRPSDAPASSISLLLP